MDPTGADHVWAALKEPVSVVLFFMVTVLLGALGWLTVDRRSFEKAYAAERDAWAKRVDEIRSEQIESARESSDLLIKAMSANREAVAGINTLLDRLTSAAGNSAAALTNIQQLLDRNRDAIERAREAAERTKDAVERWQGHGRGAGEGTRRA